VTAMPETAVYCGHCGEALDGAGHQRPELLAHRLEMGRRGRLRAQVHRCLGRRGGRSCARRLRPDQVNPCRYHAVHRLQRSRELSGLRFDEKRVLLHRVGNQARLQELAHSGWPRPGQAELGEHPHRVGRVGGWNLHRPGRRPAVLHHLRCPEPSLHQNGLDLVGLPLVQRVLNPRLAARTGQQEPRQEESKPGRRTGRHS